MLLRIVLLLVMTTCVEVSSHVECNNVATDDPCSCSAHMLFISVNDTVTPGSPIAFFNGSVQPSVTSSCSDFNITDGQFILLVDLRNPCASDKTCGIQCGDDSKTITVVVNHVDVHPPVFPNTAFTTDIFENKEVDTLVFDFSTPENKPTDADCPEEKSMNYFVKQGTDGEEYFHFPQKSSGELILQKALDYEESELYNVTVGVTTSYLGISGREGFTNVIVNIKDFDDNDPAFDNLEYRLNVTEETISTTQLSGSPPVRGYDKDKGLNQTILYSFSDYRSSSDFLKINTADGTFSVTKAIDRENTSSYEMILWCFQSDKHEKRASARLFVHVLDINDNPAILSPEIYDVTLVENAVGYVTTVSATDKDSGDNAAVIYELANVTETFEVNNSSGEVRVKTSADLDREKTPVITILVRAKDKEGNHSANTATVVITLQDINDNRPEFIKDFYVFHINATNDGDIVGQVNATDSDEVGSPNANVTYELYPASTSVPFTIDELAGTLAVHGQFDLKTDYNFLVRACDNPVEASDRRCSIVSVVVLYGKNDTFVTEEVSMEVRENVPVGTKFGNVLPVTGDEYVCSTEDFDVDIQSGMMVTKIELDRETNDTYIINVQVLKYTESKGNVSLTISVLDVNDNAPTFLQEEYIFNIPESVDRSTLLGSLTATDADQAENANLTFSFQQTSSGLFAIDDVTGNVTASDQWKDNTVYKQSLHHLIAVVADKGEPPLMSVASVYISTMKINPDSAVGIPTTLPKATVMKDDTKPMIERELGDLLGFDVVQVTAFDETTSHIFVKAYLNDTGVNVTDLQRSLVQNWSPVQELFRQYMEPRSALEHSSTDLSTAEIALITISVAVFFGGLISIIIICKQWDTHLKNHRLYDTLRRSSTMYDSQELRMDFSEEELPSRFSTFRGPGRKENENLEGSFGLGFVNSAYNCDGEEINAPTTPTWNCNDTPRVPRWSTSDSLKDAMESLEELTHRLNSEDNISRVSNMSRGGKSQKSNKSEPVTPRSETNHAPNSSETRVSNKYEDFVLSPSSEYQKVNVAPKYENLILRPSSEKDVVKDIYKSRDHEDGYDSGISEAERIQEIIETNQKTDDFDNAEVASLGVVGDIVLEESTAF